MKIDGTREMGLLGRTWQHCVMDDMKSFGLCHKDSNVN